MRMIWFPSNAYQFMPAMHSMQGRTAGLTLNHGPVSGREQTAGEEKTAPLEGGAEP